MASFIRKRVSQNRVRNRDGSYDLDLTYITKDIIAMGMPTNKKLESIARNSLSDVANFLRHKHGNSFKVYNLLQEQTYNFLAFGNMVETYPTEDHHPPLFKNLERFCHSVEEWLKESETNVVVVHCKAGKGRTGTMIASYFLYSQRFETPNEAIEYFNSKRCIDSKGITIPSQKRYIEYFGDYLRQSRVYQSTKLYLKSIEIESLISGEIKNINYLSFKVFRNLNTKHFDSNDTKITKKQNEFYLRIDQIVPLVDDIKIAFYGKNAYGKSYLFHVVFNTFCLIQNNIYKDTKNNSLGEVLLENEQIEWILGKNNIDNACKDKRFSSDLKVKFKFYRCLGGSLQSSVIKSGKSDEVSNKSNDDAKQTSSLMRSQSQIEIPITFEKEGKENDKKKKFNMLNLFKRNSLFNASAKKPKKSTRKSHDNKHVANNDDSPASKTYEILSNSSSIQVLGECNVDVCKETLSNSSSLASSSLQDINQKSNFGKFFSRI